VVTDNNKNCWDVCLYEEDFQSIAFSVLLWKLSVIDAFIDRNAIGGELYILRRLGFPANRVFMGIIRIYTTG